VDGARFLNPLDLKSIRFIKKEVPIVKIIFIISFTTCTQIKLRKTNIKYFVFKNSAAISPLICENVD